MKYERSDENTIRVWITIEDLKQRKMELSDFVNDKGKAEQFFYSILEEVDDDDDFKSNDLVSFQILPSSDALQIIISKDNKTLSNLAESGVKFMSDSDQAKEKLEKIREANQPVDEFDEENGIRIVPIYFADFERLVKSINEINNTKVKSIFSNPNITIQTDLYKNQTGYYLIFYFALNVKKDISESKSKQLKTIDDLLAFIYEYGNLSKIRANEIKTQNKLIIKNSATEIIDKYFI